MAFVSCQQKQTDIAFDKLKAEIDSMRYSHHSIPVINSLPIITDTTIK